MAHTVKKKKTKKKRRGKKPFNKNDCVRSYNTAPCTIEKEKDVFFLVRNWLGCCGRWSPI